MDHDIRKDEFFKNSTNIGAFNYLNDSLLNNFGDESSGSFSSFKYGSSKLNNQNMNCQSEIVSCVLNNSCYEMNANLTQKSQHINILKPQSLKNPSQSNPQIPLSNTNTNLSVREQVSIAFDKDDHFRENLFNQLFHKKQVKKPPVVGTTSEIKHFWNVHKNLFTNWITYTNRYGQSKLLMVNGFDEFDDYDWFSDLEIQEMKNNPSYAKYVPKVIERQMAKKISEMGNFQNRNIGNGESNTCKTDLNFVCEFKLGKKVDNFADRFKNRNKRKQTLEVKHCSDAEWFELDQPQNYEIAKLPESSDLNVEKFVPEDNNFNQAKENENFDVSVDDILEKNLADNHRIEGNYYLYDYVFGDKLFDKYLNENIEETVEKDLINFTEHLNKGFSNLNLCNSDDSGKANLINFQDSIKDSNHTGFNNATLIPNEESSGGKNLINNSIETDKQLIHFSEYLRDVNFDEINFNNQLTQNSISSTGNINKDLNNTKVKKSIQIDKIDLDKLINNHLHKNSNNNETDVKDLINFTEKPNTESDDSNLCEKFKKEPFLMENSSNDLCETLKGINKKDVINNAKNLNKGSYETYLSEIHDEFANLDDPNVLNTYSHAQSAIVDSNLAEENNLMIALPSEMSENEATVEDVHLIGHIIKHLSESYDFSQELTIIIKDDEEIESTTEDENIMEIIISENGCTSNVKAVYTQFLKEDDDYEIIPDEEQRVNLEDVEHEEIVHTYQKQSNNFSVNSLDEHIDNSTAIFGEQLNNYTTNLTSENLMNLYQKSEFGVTSVKLIVDDLISNDGLSDDELSDKLTIDENYCDETSIKQISCTSAKVENYENSVHGLSKDCEELQERSNYLTILQEYRQYQKTTNELQVHNTLDKLCVDKGSFYVNDFRKIEKESLGSNRSLFLNLKVNLNSSFFKQNYYLIKSCISTAIITIRNFGIVLDLDIVRNLNKKPYMVVKKSTNIVLQINNKLSKASKMEQRKNSTKSLTQILEDLGQHLELKHLTKISIRIPHNVQQMENDIQEIIDLTTDELTERRTNFFEPLEIIDLTNDDAENIDHKPDVNSINMSFSNISQTFQKKIVDDRKHFISNETSNVIRVDSDNEIKIISSEHNTEIIYNFFKEQVELVEIDSEKQISKTKKKRQNEFEQLLNVHNVPFSSDQLNPSILSDQTKQILPTKNYPKTKRTPIDSSARLVINEIVTSPSTCRITRNKLHNFELSESLKRKSDIAENNNDCKRHQSNNLLQMNESIRIEHNTTESKKRKYLFPTKNCILAKKIKRVRKENQESTQIINRTIIEKSRRSCVFKSYKFSNKNANCEKNLWSSYQKPQSSNIFHLTGLHQLGNHSNSQITVEEEPNYAAKNVSIAHVKKNVDMTTKVNSMGPINNDVNKYYLRSVKNPRRDSSEINENINKLNKQKQNTTNNASNPFNNKLNKIHENRKFVSTKNSIRQIPLPSHTTVIPSNFRPLPILKESTKETLIKKNTISKKYHKNKAIIDPEKMTHPRRFSTRLKNSKPSKLPLKKLTKKSCKILKKNMYKTPKLDNETIQNEIMVQNTSANVEDLMNYLTIPHVDQFTENREYLVYIAQIHSRDIDLPELKLTPFNEPKFEYVDANIILDESDYGVSDTSSDEGFVNSADLTLSNYLKYHRMQSFFQSKKRPTDEELVKKYKVLKCGHKNSDEKSEKLSDSDARNSHNRYIRLNERVLRKRCKHDKDMRSHAMKPLNQMSYDEINSLREVDLISFLTFRDYIKSKQELPPPEHTQHKKQHDLKVELRPILDHENIKRINSKNWKNEDVQWFLKNVNCSKYSKFVYRKHRIRLLKDHISNNRKMKFRSFEARKSQNSLHKGDNKMEENADKNSTPSTSYSSGDFTTQRKSKSYDSDSDSSVDENYISILNQQVKLKREQNKQLREKLLLNDLQTLTLGFHKLDFEGQNEKSVYTNLMTAFVSVPEILTNGSLELKKSLLPFNEEYKTQISLSDYNDIVCKMAGICLQYHSKKFHLNVNPAAEFIGFPSTDVVYRMLKKNKQFVDHELELIVSMANQDDIELLKYKSYCEHSKKYKMNSFFKQQCGQNDVTSLSYTKNNANIENADLETNAKNLFGESNIVASTEFQSGGICYDNPVTEKSREKEDLLLLARTPDGEFVGIKYDTDRPETFENELARLQWTDVSIRNILKLKSQIEHGEISPKQSNIVTNPQLTIEERILAIEKCVVRRKQERLHWLQLESKLVEYDSEIKSYLGLERADTEKALHCLIEILGLPIEQLMLTKHPHVVDMVRRLRRYIGNVKAWNLSDEQAIEFGRGAEQIRQKADEVYQKFKTLYETEHDKSFSDIYNNHVKEFNLKTKNMKEAQRFAVCAKPGTRQFEMDQMDDQLEIEAIKLKNELENKKPRNETPSTTEKGATSSGM